jgi:hypothetical protein
MKKMLKIIFFAFMFFIIDTEMVEAADYFYDITEVRIEGANLVIQGWAVYRPANRVHQVQPNFSLDIIDSKKSTLLMTLNDVEEAKNNYSERETKFNKTSTNFTISYYQQVSGQMTIAQIHQNYPDEFNYRVALAVKNSMSSSDNRIYVNNNFKFEIPMTELIKKIEQNNVEEMHLNLTISQSAQPNVEVYGVTFNLSAFNKEIKKIVAHPRVMKIFNYTDANIGFNVNFESSYNQVTIGISDAYVQMSQILGLKRFTCKSIEDGLWGPIDATNLSYMPFAKFINGSSYNVIDRITSDQEYIRTGFMLGMYNVLFNPYWRSTSLCTAENNGSTAGYTPATWIIPASGTFFKLVVENKEEDEEPLPPPDECDYDDALSQYCCLYPEDRELCDDLIIPQDENNFRNTSCSSNKKTEEMYKYPKNPTISKLGHPLVMYDVKGHTKTNSTTNNSACYISCQEKIIVKFEREPRVKAGMGFKYPVAVNGTRICGAIYENEDWVENYNDVIEGVKDSYDDMIEYINKAKKLDTDCGTMKTLTKPVKSCPSDCSSRSGLTCNGCTCSGSSCSNCGRKPDYPCPTENDPSKMCRGSCRSCSWTCSKSTSCPSGYSYRSSGDICIREVCSRKESWLWSSAQSDIQSEINKANNAKDKYENYIDQKDKLEKDQAFCDDWVNSNTYLKNPRTSITTSGLNPQNSYSLMSPTSYSAKNSSFAAKRYYTNTVFLKSNCSKSNYKAPSLVGDKSVSSFSGSYCSEISSSNITYKDVWVEKSTRDLDYEFYNKYYIQRYTGDYQKTSRPGYDYHGRYFYTDFFAKSDKYGYLLNTISIGPNIDPALTKNWGLNLVCAYNLTNWIFPPKGDPQYDLYGSTTFRYRTVLLDNPFPNREPGSNWNLSNNQIAAIMKPANPRTYQIVLTSGMRADIRNFNIGKSYNYTSFNLNNPYESELINITQNNLIQINSLYR